MAPRSSTLPEASTDSAREARKAFFCDLCQKGYARMPEFEAHENSYDHQHRKRLKEMRQITKDPSAAARQRAAEEKANAESGLKSISLSSKDASAAAAGSGKRKPVFKSTLQSQSSKPVEVEATSTFPLLDDVSSAAAAKDISAAQQRTEALAWIQGEMERIEPSPLPSREKVFKNMEKRREERKADGSYELLQQYRHLKLQKYIIDGCAAGFDATTEFQQDDEFDKREAEDLAMYG